MTRAQTVSIRPLAEADRAVRAWRLVSPRPEPQVNPYALALRGWVIGGPAPAVAVEVAHGSASVLTLPLAQRSLEPAREAGAGMGGPARAVMQARLFAARGLSRIGYPVQGAAGAVGRVLRPDVLYSGFDGTLPLLGLPARCTLRLSVRLADGTRAGLAELDIDRPQMRSGLGALYQPLMVTSIGRSGSTWLQHLISQHPAVAAFRAHGYEATVARELVTLAARSAGAGPYAESFFVKKGFRSLFTGPEAGDAMEGVVRAVGAGVHDLAADAVRGIDRFYALADEMDGRPAAREGETRYFTEKNLRPEWFYWEAYPRAKEIFLVRDFRDVICSSLAANAKWGTQFFGRRDAADDRDFVYRRAKMARPWILESWRARGPRAHLVRYEELIRDPEPVVARMLEYLELDAAPSVVREMLASAERTQGAGKRDRHMTSADPALSIGRWKTDLSPEMARACDEAFAEFFQAFYTEPAPAAASGTRASR